MDDHRAADEHRATDEHHDAESDHEHGGHRSVGTRKLALVAGINVVGFLAEFGGGLAFGSVALVSDAVHMLFDALAYVMAFAAAYAAERYARSEAWSFGLHRLEPLSAFLNGVLLVPMVGYILLESYRRLQAPVGLDVGPTLAIAIGGLVVNLGSVYVLAGGEMSLNERGAFYHLLGDAGGSVAVIVAVAGVALTGVDLLDPAAAVLVAALVLWSAWRVLRGSAVIFLHGAPVSASTARTALTDVDGVTTVGDFHSWQICSRITVATAHVDAEVADVDDVAAVADRVHERLADLGVDHATVEVRPEGTSATVDRRHGH